MRKITIGRAPDNDIVFDVPSISSHHGEVVADNGTVVYIDHSTNGSWIDGLTVHHASCEIGEGDQIVLPGNVVLDWNMIVSKFNRTMCWTPGSAYETPPVNTVSSADNNTANNNSVNTVNNADNGYCHRDDGARMTTKSMSMGKSLSSIFANYAVFTGRARRSEYWWFYLFNILVAWIPIIGWLWALAVLIPSLAVGVRRLHDTGKSGWYLLFCLIPLVGSILLIVWFCQDSEPGPNKYGPSPKYV